MPKNLRAQVYKNKKGEQGLQISMSLEDGKAIAISDKPKLKELLEAIKEAVK